VPCARQIKGADKAIMTATDDDDFRTLIIHKLSPAHKNKILMALHYITTGRVSPHEWSFHMKTISQAL
jgi:hypothetical protein